jgi:hypothetical protein
VHRSDGCLCRRIGAIVGSKWNRGIAYKMKTCPPDANTRLIVKYWPSPLVAALDSAPRNWPVRCFGAGADGLRCQGLGRLHGDGHFLWRVRVRGGLSTTRRHATTGTVDPERNCAWDTAGWGSHASAPL